MASRLAHHQVDEIVDAVVLKAMAAIGAEDRVDNDSPADWETDDRITFGMWRAAIREVLSK